MPAADEAHGAICAEYEIPTPEPDDPLLRTGGIVGAVYLADVTPTPDPDWEGGWWDEESFAWLVSDAAEIIEFVPMKGKLGLFDLELPFEISWKESVE